MSKLNQHQTQSMQTARFGLIKFVVLAEIALLLVFLVHYFRQGSGARTLTLLLLAAAICALPIFAQLFWKAQITKTTNNTAKIPVYKLPYTSHAASFGATLTVREDALVWRSNLKAVQEVPLSSVKEIAIIRRDLGDFRTGTVGNSYWLEFATTNSSDSVGESQLTTIGLTQFPKEHWPIIVDAIAENSPNAQINELAKLVKAGQVPSFKRWRFIDANIRPTKRCTRPLCMV